MSVKEVLIMTALRKDSVVCKVSIDDDITKKRLGCL